MIKIKSSIKRTHNSETNEQALEDAIEKVPTGAYLEGIKTGLQKATPDFDMHYALGINYFWLFLKSTQEKLEKLKRNSLYD